MHQFRIASVIAIVALCMVASDRADAGFDTYCDEPNPPWCLNNSLSDRSSFNQCRSEVDSYVDRVNNYVDCLRDAQRSAIKRANDVVRRFNCKAEGRTCF